MILHQIRSNDGTGTLSYLVACDNTKSAAVIDPNLEDVQTIGYLADELGVKITTIIDTHTHADHVSGTNELKKHFDAKLYMHERTKQKEEVLKNAAKFGIEDILQANVKMKVDEYVEDGDIIEIGDLKMKVLHTPGHTDNHIAILAEDVLFTGDLLLIGQAGRSDLPGGNTEDQYDTLFNKIVTLPEKTKIYPGHDYEENTFAFLGDELGNNPFLEKRTKEEYIEFVKDFFPPFAESVSGEKVTLQCGAKRVVQPSDKFKNISSDDLYRMLTNGEDIFLLDVREEFELMMGKVDGVVNIPMGQLKSRINELPEDKSRKIVSICASGNRSTEAAHFLAVDGYSDVMNLSGGTYGWLTKGYTVEKV